MPTLEIQALCREGEYSRLLGILRPSEVARLSTDLRVISAKLSPAEIRKHYLKPLLAGDRGGIAEMFVAARLARTAIRYTPHSPTGIGGRSYDIHCMYARGRLDVEVKRQRDSFPFNRPPEIADEGFAIYAGSRPGADPRYLDSAPPHTTDPLPGSTIYRATLEEAAEQLPRDGTGVIALCVDAPGISVVDDVIAAVLGDEIPVAVREFDGPPSKVTIERLGNGVFAKEGFKHVLGVWSFRLIDAHTDPSAPLQCERAFAIPNPRFEGPSPPESVDLLFPNVVDRLLAEYS